MDHKNAFLSDDDEKDLDRVDTMMLHFGNGKFTQTTPGNGVPTAVERSGINDMRKVYRSRREELEDRIRKKKMAMVNKMKGKEDQVKTSKHMDESFPELLPPHNFRDKEQDESQEAQGKDERGA